MAVLPESTTPLSTPPQAQVPIPPVSDREPTVSHAGTSSQPTLEEVSDGTPTGWFASLCPKTGHAFLEIMGYRARRDMPLRSWAFAKFTVSWVLALPQIIAVVIVTCLAFMHPSPPHNIHSPPPFSGRSEYDSCRSLAVSNIVWAVKLFIQLFPDVWFLRRRLKMRGEPVQGMPIIQVCPPDIATSMNLGTFLDVVIVSTWILLQVVFHLVNGKQCYADAPRVSALAAVILPLAFLYYLPTSLLLIARRCRESRSDGSDDIEIGPLPQSKVDRIDVVYYIPHPPPAAAAARPPKPVAGFRRIGRVLRPRATDADAEQGLGSPYANGHGDWENTFQRMPRALLRIDKHEAQCAICLDEYTEPPRAIPGSATASATQRAIADAQGAPEPLRWLDCGHVFHKGCLDPCLTQGPAKCPTCRTPVKVRPLARKK